MSHTDFEEFFGRRVCLFQGEEVTVFAKLTTGFSFVVATFSGRSADSKDAITETGAAEGFMDKNGISAVYFLAKSNIWWQTEEFPQALNVVRAILDKLNFGEVVTYGSSMGGYGALLAAGSLGARRVVCAAPQYTIDPSVVPWETRYKRDARKIKFISRPLENYMGDAEVIILSDPFYDTDQRHVKLIGRNRVVQHLHVPFAGHAVLPMLSQLGVISQTINAALRGTINVGTYRRNLRTARCGHWFALAGAARAEHQHKRLRSALRFSTRAYQGILMLPDREVRPSLDWVIEIHGDVLAANGLIDEALAVLQNWSVRAGPSRFWLLLKRGKFHEMAENGAAAYSAYTEALRLRPYDRDAIQNAIRLIKSEAQVLDFLNVHRDGILRYASSVEKITKKISYYTDKATLITFLNIAETTHPVLVETLRASHRHSDEDLTN
jgi:pimeloyl-ACP methyl ester carboxylesterase